MLPLGAKRTMDARSVYAAAMTGESPMIASSPFAALRVGAASNDTTILLGMSGISVQPDDVLNARRLPAEPITGASDKSIAAFSFVDLKPEHPALSALRPTRTNRAPRPQL